MGGKDLKYDTDLYNMPASMYKNATAWYISPSNRLECLFNAISYT